MPVFLKQSLPRFIASSTAGASGTGCRFRSPLSISLALRVDLRRRNLFDTETAPLDPSVPTGFDIRHCRTADGTFNDLSKTWMGMANARASDAMRRSRKRSAEQPPSLYEPNPRVISRDLLARRDFVPATTVNLFLAAWLQFMVHDWLSHGVNDKQSPPLRFPFPPGDDWPKPEMTILRTCPDHQRGPRDEGRPATYRNIVTHWWDGSQMYGSDLQMQHCVRSSPAKVLLPDGKLYLDETGHLPLDPEAADDDPLRELAAVNGNWWIGLSTMHTLFTREHNSIVDRLHIEYPDKDGEWLFQKARLINAALIVKIHATEWTPALLQSPTLQYAMRGSWWGALGEAYFKAFGRPARDELLSGIPASRNRTTCRAVCDHRRVHGGLSPALANSGRFFVPPAQRRQGNPRLHHGRSVWRRHYQGAPEGAVRRRALFDRHELPGRAGAAQLSDPSAPAS